LCFDHSVVHNALLLLYARDTLHELVNVTANADWKSYCARITTNVFSGAVSALYVRHYTEDYLNALKDRVRIITILLCIHCKFIILHSGYKAVRSTKGDVGTSYHY
jgi:hypothetical protein